MTFEYYYTELRGSSKLFGPVGKLTDALPVEQLKESMTEQMTERGFARTRRITRELRRTPLNRQDAERRSIERVDEQRAAFVAALVDACRVRAW